MPENENTGELHESPLDPAEDERIRRLLADARHTEPMPEAVVARLDRVLSGLSDDRTERGPSGPTAPRSSTSWPVAAGPSASSSSPRLPSWPWASASPRSSRTWVAAPTGTPRRPRRGVRPPTAPMGATARGLGS